MFNFFKKKNKGLEVDAAVDGELIPITEVLSTLLVLRPKKD